jgi:adenine-specific DNA-methyltransferase
LIKKQIIGNNAIFVNFVYENPENKNWRFSFIAYDSVFEDGDIITAETNPKRYTYIFGEKEETYKTAIDCFSKLADEFEIKIAKIKDAFGVEAMSKAFFDEYRDRHYKNFINHLLHSNYKISAFDGNEKAIRDFVKKLLGRIVFLYFLQKKGWLGASSTKYTDGDKNFISNFFKEAKQGPDFYPVWLSKLFFDTLNEKRTDDNFTMPNGKVIKIPYLNGGLFERESAKYDFITFDSELFINLFEFFDQYNFTVYEDSPDDHTVAVDPEMLGHIFENLLEDNKDKGAFYTPKQIVQYMTQESLTEYLITHLPNTNKGKLSSFVKDKVSELSKDELKEIDRLLDNVKICDPAIGSGAFPMGLLQEIFGLKENIAFELGFEVWSPAIVKENIIQNSIYGVDIEKGAVDIARLRFWLSLIVDEDLPKALPNLDYKIVVGDSLVSKFENEIIEIDWEVTAEVHNDLFGSPLQEEKEQLLMEISAKQKLFFHTESKDKKKLAADIRKTKAKLLSKQLEQMIATKGFKEDKAKTLNKKQLEAKLETEGWKKTLVDLKRIVQHSELSFNHFDWKLDFPEVLNPLVNENKIGFDIVIGNPPYIDSETMVNNGQEYLREILTKKLNFTRGNWDIYIAFFEVAFNLLNSKGNMTYITPDKWISKPFGYELRKGLLNNYRVVTEAGRKVFITAKVDSIITFISKQEYTNLQVNNIIDYKINPLTNLSKSQFIEPLAFDWLFSPFIQVLEKIELSTSTLKNYLVCENACATSDAYKLKEYVYDLANKDFDNEKYLRIINTGTIDKYIDKWGNKDMTYLKDKYANPVVDRLIFLREFNNSYGKKSIKKKLIIKGLTLLDVCLDFNGEVIPGKSTLVIPADDIQKLKYLMLILNSKLPIFYIKEKYRGSSYNQGINFSKDMINELPFPVNSKFENIFVIIADFLITIKQISEFDKLNSHVPNSHIIEAFEEVIDAMVFELYFPQEFNEAGIEFIKYVERDFKSIDGLDIEQQKELIHDAYQKMRDKNNEIRNNIILMKIELRDLLMPILSI